MNSTSSAASGDGLFAVRFQSGLRAQIVYFVIVRDKNGVERSGWVRCGGWFLRLLASDVDVHWDDPIDSGSGDFALLIQTLPRRWLLVIVLVIVALAALLFLLIPKPAPFQI